MLRKQNFLRNAPQTGDKERRKEGESFFITNYPDIILLLFQILQPAITYFFEVHKILLFNFYYAYYSMQSFLSNQITINNSSAT